MIVDLLNVINVVDLYCDASLSLICGDGHLVSISSIVFSWKTHTERAAGTIG
jgi:hypothetical protein